MQRMWDDMRAGWKTARWSLTFGLIFLPLGLSALLIAYLIGGPAAMPPAGWARDLVTLAGIVSIVLTGLRDGPLGQFGRYIWFPILLVRKTERQVPLACHAASAARKRITRMAIKLTYQLSEECQRQAMIATGSAIRTHTVPINVLDLTPAQRETLYEYFAEQPFREHDVFRAEVPGTVLREDYPWGVAPLTLDQTVNATELLLILEAQLPKYQQVRQEEKRRKKEREDADRTRLAAIQKAHEENTARHAANRQAKQQSKREWIAQFGSEHLRRATDAGYDCQRQYVTERAAIEWPEYFVDFDEKAVLRDRTCPSPLALDIAERTNGRGRVMWVASSMSNRPPSEVVVVSDYLDDYRLMLPVPDAGS